MHTATYSPDDNKLRLYPAGRLDAETFARVKAAGFRWAPQQKLFVAPMWTPGREDLLTELCGEIGDDDASLMDRAEDRAERFEDHSDNRRADAESARKAVAAIADNIPLGQPILVGHHSERHARKDAARIENGMRRAVKMWETAEYWKDRAAGAIRHARYKERSDVRTRRIKGIEADKRKAEKETAEANTFSALWRKVGDPNSGARLKDGTPATSRDVALYVANRDHVSRCFPLADFPRDPPASQYEGETSLWSALDGNMITAEQARDIAIAAHERGNARRARWIGHYDNRLAYERAMLADAGGTVADKTGPQVGGGCKCWASARGGWSYIKKVNKISVTVLDNWGRGGANFTRTIPFDKLSGVMTAAQVAEKRAAGLLHDLPDGTGYFLREQPADDVKAETANVHRHETDIAPIVPAATPAADFAAMREALRQGVQVVSAPQLFPTPRDLAQRVADLAAVQPGHRVLEPSAGTGSLLGALGCRMFTAEPRQGEVVAVELNTRLAYRLRQEYPLTDVRQGDFLACNGDLGLFDRVVMNPPFANADDIRHIEHAAKMLKPGGRLVAICANGPRQRDQLKPQASMWEDLPAGTFKDQGTSVNVALLVIDA